jgi:hypothetical protein
MKTFTLALAAGAATLLAACNQTPTEKAADQIEDQGAAQADAVRADAEVRADSLEKQADAIDNGNMSATADAKADTMENQADVVRDNAEMKADQVETNADKAADATRDQK